MDVQSLAFRTELALLERAGSTVEDHGTHVVVRTPTNPTYFWGNFVLVPDAPSDTAAVEHWAGVHRAAFPDAGHVSIGIDRPRDLAADGAVLRDAGLEVDEVVSMTATSVRAPATPPPSARVRPLEGDDDWAQQVEVMMEGEDDAHITREFAAGKVAANRALVEGGTGTWWGAWDDDRLVASLGIFTAGDGLARFQSVKTVTSHRGRGLAGALVVRASRQALSELGAHTLVMAADPSYAAIRIYRAVGFTDGGTHLEATRRPAS